MKLIALTILVVAVTAFAALPAETTHACASLVAYDTVAEYAAGNTGVTDNGDGTVTINKGSPDHELTYEPQLGQGDCPSGGGNPARAISNPSVRHPQNGPAPVSPRVSITQQRPTVVRNAVYDVQASQGDVFYVKLRQFFRGNRITFTAKSSDTTVATVSVTNDRIILTITATATKASYAETAETVKCHSQMSGIPGLLCGSIVHRTLPYEHETASITMTASNNAGSVSTSFDVTVFLDPNRY